MVWIKSRRLTSATNPENGTVSYTYDGNGNVLTKRDGRGEPDVADGRGASGLRRGEPAEDV